MTAAPYRTVLNSNIVHLHVVPAGYLYRLVNGLPTYVPPTAYWSEQPLVPEKP